MASNTVVNTNVLALNANRNLGKVGIKQSKASQKLSSGLRINSAADDAAGLAISEGMRSQIRGLDMASKNTQDGISLIQTAEGGTSEIGNMVQRIRELAVQANNGTNTDDDKAKIQLEVGQLVTEITDMANRTEFNGMALIGENATAAAGTVTLQIGANEGQTTDIELKDITQEAGLSALLSGADVETDAAATITLADEALQEINGFRANLGAYQNRLEYTMSSLDISSENLSASESRIRDTDMAKEMMNLTKANVLQQAATSMLAQANQAPQNVLQLVQ